MIISKENWTVKDYRSIRSNGKLLAILSDDLDFPDSYDTSNLMAAAPDLYLALEEAVRNHEHTSNWVEKAKLALAKADGEQS